MVLSVLIPGGSTNVVNFQDLTSAGPFTYTIAATDQSGLVDRCQINFDGESTAYAFAPSTSQLRMYGWVLIRICWVGSY